MSLEGVPLVGVLDGKELVFGNSQHGVYTCVSKKHSTLCGLIHILSITQVEFTLTRHLLRNRDYIIIY